MTLRTHCITPTKPSSTRTMQVQTQINFIEQLNQAINLTSQAQQLINTDPQQAETLANQAQTIAQNITQQATTAKQSASNILPIIAIATAAALIVAGINNLRIWAKSPVENMVQTQKKLPRKKQKFPDQEQNPCHYSGTIMCHSLGYNGHYSIFLSFRIFTSEKSR